MLASNFIYFLFLLSFQFYELLSMRDIEIVSKVKIIKGSKLVQV